MVYKSAIYDGTYDGIYKGCFTEKTTKTFFGLYLTIINILKTVFFFLQFQTCLINNSPKGLLNFKTYSVMSNAPNYYLGPLF